MELIPLAWDSDFFRLRIAKAVVSSEEDVLSLSSQRRELRHSYDLIYVFSEQDIIIPFKRASLVDKKALFTLNEPTHFDTNPAIQQWNEVKTSDGLVSLALVSGKYSRFKIDPLFPEGSYERLYTHWIEQSVNRTIATDVFCFIMDNCPRGLLTLNCAESRNVIGLVAVDENYQKKGIGTALVKYAISFVKERNGSSLSVATQKDNEAACRLYSKCGFSLESVTNVWHWWL